jgi:hypothetical protein
VFTWTNGSEGMRETVLRLGRRAIPQLDWTPPTNERTSVKGRREEKRWVA